MDSADHPPPMTSTPSEELESCPVCGALPADQVDSAAVRELVRNPYKLSRQGILDDCSSRRSVLEEAARVADEYVRDLDCPTFARACAENIARRIRAIAEEEP